MRHQLNCLRPGMWLLRSGQGQTPEAAAVGSQEGGRGGGRRGGWRRKGCVACWDCSTACRCALCSRQPLAAVPVSQPVQPARKGDWQTAQCCSLLPPIPAAPPPSMHTAAPHPQTTSAARGASGGGFRRARLDRRWTGTTMRRMPRRRRGGGRRPPKPRSARRVRIAVRHGLHVEEV